MYMYICIYIYIYVQICIHHLFLQSSLSMIADCLVRVGYISWRNCALWLSRDTRRVEGLTAVGMLGNHFLREDDKESI